MKANLPKVLNLGKVIHFFGFFNLVQAACKQHQNLWPSCGGGWVGVYKRGKHLMLLYRSE